MATMLTTRLLRRLMRVLRVGQGRSETRSPDEINRQAHAQAHSEMKGWH